MEQGQGKPSPYGSCKLVAKKQEFTILLCGVSRFRDSAAFRFKVRVTGGYNARACHGYGDGFCRTGFFLSCRVLPARQKLSESEFAILAEVIWERRKLNRVKAGRVERPDDWKSSSGHGDTRTIGAPAGAGSPIPVHRITLPADPRTRI